MRAIVVTEFGGPDKLILTDIPDPVAGSGEVLIEVARAGVNYADTHQAEDTYLSRTQLPLVPGGEVVGRTGDGRRVVALVDSGGYAQRAVADARRVFDVPDAVDDVSALAPRGAGCDGVAAAAPHRPRAAGGVGRRARRRRAASARLAVQLARSLGAGRVIATASTAEKRELALSLGADVALDADVRRSHRPPCARPTAVVGWTRCWI